MKWNFNELRLGDEKQGVRDGDMSDFSNSFHYWTLWLVCFRNLHYLESNKY